MNLSAKAVRDCDEGKDDGRPDYVNELRVSRQVGFKEGSPIVGDRMPLDGDKNDAYSHYRRNKQIFVPSSGPFLEALFESDLITSVQEASREIRTDVSDIRQACTVHGIEIDDLEGGDVDRDENDPDVLELPSGETWGTDVLHPVESDCRVLTQLLATDGMSVGETATFLSDQLDRDVKESDVKENARLCGLL